MTKHTQPAKCDRCEERLVSVQDVANAFKEHMGQLDNLWPDSERYGPRKVHIVELLDSVRLRLYQKAESNATKNISAFEAAARRVTGYKPTTLTAPQLEATPFEPFEKAAHAAMRDRIARNSK